MAWRSSELESSSTAEAKKKIGAVPLLSTTRLVPLPQIAVVLPSKDENGRKNTILSRSYFYMYLVYFRIYENWTGSEKECIRPYLRGPILIRDDSVLVQYL